MSSVLLNGIENGGLTSLRKTRLSEVSTFVKNYNNAQSRFMRKEVLVYLIASIYSSYIVVVAIVFVVLILKCLTAMAIYTD